MTIINQDLEAAATLQALIDAEAEAMPVAAKTGTQRSKEIQAAIDNNNVDEFMKLQAKLTTHLQQIVGNKIDLENLGLLTDEQIVSFTQELLDNKDLERLLKDVRYAMLREAFFAHITARNAAKGMANPEHTPGEVKVPALGKRIVREGGKIKATLDLGKLQEALGEKWDQVTNTIEHPAVKAYVEQVFDEEKMLALVTENPKLMDVMAACVIPAGYGVERLRHYNLNKKDSPDE